MQKTERIPARSNEEFIMVAYLLGWTGDWKRMERALNKRYARLQARKRRAVVN